MMRYLFVLLVFFISQNLYGQRVITGEVKANGKGVANVIVSSGFQFTETDKRGKFKLAINEGNKFVQITNPSGYLVEQENSVPLFYHELHDSVRNYNFTLVKNPKDETNHSLVVQTDVQVANVDELSVYTEKILPDLKATINSLNENDVIGVDLGDIVGDDPKLYSPYIESMSVLNTPFYRVIGNHDMAYRGRTFETSETHFNKHFGPTRYSFNKGNVHYIVINNSFYIGRDYFYMGYIDESTFRWLEKDLSYVPKGATVFLMAHIPTQLKAKQGPFSYNYELMGGTTINSAALYDVLSDYKVHILSGHTHRSHNIEHNENLFEHNIAAASGSWWQLELCTDGTPRGYRVFEVEGDKVRWYYKTAGREKDYQFRSVKDSTGDIVVNIWNYDPQWKVEWFENSVSKGEIKQFTGVDPKVAELTKDKSRFKYQWIGPSNTTHLFRIKPESKESKITIRVTDRFGHIYEDLIE